MRNRPSHVHVGQANQIQHIHKEFNRGLHSTDLFWSSELSCIFLEETVSETVSASTQKKEKNVFKKKKTKKTQPSAALDQSALWSLTGTKSVGKRRDSLSWCSLFRKAAAAAVSDAGAVAAAAGDSEGDWGGAKNMNAQGNTLSTCSACRSGGAPISTNWSKRLRWKWMGARAGPGEAKHLVREPAKTSWTFVLGWNVEFCWGKAHAGIGNRLGKEGGRVEGQPWVWLLTS